MCRKWIQSAMLLAEIMKNIRVSFHLGVDKKYFEIDGIPQKRCHQYIHVTIVKITARGRYYSG